MQVSSRFSPVHRVNEVTASRAVRGTRESCGGTERRHAQLL
jgi:hypothetical protein